MPKMASHYPFGYLKHKLWAKEGPGVKLAIWLSTTKSQESLRFICVQVACHIPLKSSRQELQIFFKHNFNQRFLHKVMGLQSRESLNLKNFGTTTWESWDKMTFGCSSRGQAQRILQGGRWWVPPSSGHGESCESVFTRGSSVH
jgi:hypothetical protein